MTAFLAEPGIDTGALRVIPNRTVGLYMTSVDYGERSFSYWGGQSAARCLAEVPTGWRNCWPGATSSIFPA